jgi:hypothetical protein
MKDEIQKVTLGTNEALRVTAEGEFIWHPEADAMIEEGDFTSSPAMRHILRALRKALAAPVQEPVAWVRLEAWQSGAEWPDDCFTGIPTDGLVPLYTTPPAAPDLQAELDATNRQVEILCDALAKSRREIDALVAVARADEREACAKVCEGLPMQQEVDVRDECAAAIRARGNT